VALGDGDLLFFYTDGTVEVENERGEMFGPERLEALLQEAHSHSVVHRDIKTENIMVNSKNQIKVMDFGLAKLKGSLKLTKTLSTVGTLAYMAPEQIQGVEADHRADVFSLGVVGYELIAGSRLFPQRSVSELMATILKSGYDLSALPKYANDNRVVALVSGCLRLNPGERLSDLGEFADRANEIVRDRLSAPEKTNSGIC
jgi:serine/threonine-protein kinase